ncbi:MAG: hypothetical protein MUE61_08455 [Vicinamibacterales bacterium]|nr:hypothetical protein [Vicinamibacterales bacterium]MCU0477195.1 hypothetical protein [Chloroflexota bacterium]
MPDRATIRRLPPTRPAIAPPPGVLPEPTIPDVKQYPNPLVKRGKGR